MKKASGGVAPFLFALWILALALGSPALTRPTLNEPSFAPVVTLRANPSPEHRSPTSPTPVALADRAAFETSAPVAPAPKRRGEPPEGVSFGGRPTHRLVAVPAAGTNHASFGPATLGFLSAHRFQTLVLRC